MSFLMPKVPEPKGVPAAPTRSDTDIADQRRLFGRSGRMSTMFGGMSGGAGARYSAGVTTLGGSGGSI